MNTKTIIQYVLAGLIVIVLGALGGWYFFLRGQNSSTLSEGAARGFGTGTSPTSPFGASGGSGSASSTSQSSNIPQTPQLWHIGTGPASGIAFATTTNGVRVTYVERSTGYVFAADPMSGQNTRLTNTLMPKVYEAVFAPGNHVYERGLDDSGQISTFAGTFPSLMATSSSQALSGSSLTRGIETLALDQKSGQLVYLVTGSSGAAVWRSQLDGTKSKQIYSSVFSDWRLAVLSDSRIILTEKASDGVNGYAYELKGSGVLSSLVGPLPGLTTLPRGNSSAILFGASSGTGLSLFAQASASSSAVKLSVRTVADKCVWAPGNALIAYCAVPQSPSTGAFLDAWYRGEVHPTDAIWRIDVGAGQSQLFFTPEGNTSLDVVNPVMDDNGTYIAFLNGVDRSPWLLRLNK